MECVKSPPEEEWKCMWCSYTYTKNVMPSHVRQSHPDKYQEYKDGAKPWRPQGYKTPKKSFECRECDKAYANYNTLQTHVRKNHPHLRLNRHGGMIRWLENPLTNSTTASVSEDMLITEVDRVDSDLIEELQEQIEKEAIEKNNNELITQMAEMKLEHSEYKKNAVTQIQEKFSETERNYEAKLAKQKEHYEQKIAEMKEDYEQKIAKLKRENASDSGSDSGSDSDSDSGSASASDSASASASDSASDPNRLLEVD